MTADAMLTRGQMRLLEVAAEVRVVDGERPFLSAAELGVSPVICGRLVTMLFLESQRLPARAEDDNWTLYRITRAGLDVLETGA